jgi:hypothetical protein
MALVVKPYTFTVGATIVASEHNSNFDTIYNDYNGNVTNANLSASFSLTDDKIGQISTYGKVDGSAITNINNLNSAAGVIPAANLTSVMPSGGIILWSGSIATIPSGWYLCDGANGTPNLTNRFIIAADASVYPVGATGDGTIPAHIHTLTGYKVGGAASSGFAEAVPGGDNPVSNPNTSSYGTGTKNIATYYALAYIMKS